MAMLKSVLGFVVGVLVFSCMLVLLSIRSTPVSEAATSSITAPAEQEESEIVPSGGTTSDLPATLTDILIEDDQEEIAPSNDVMATAPIAEPEPQPIDKVDAVVLPDTEFQDDIAEDDAELSENLDIQGEESIAAEGVENAEPVQRTRRLPTIGDTSSSRIALSSEVNSTGSDAEVGLGAFDENSAAFQGRGVPVLSIVLFDKGVDGASRSDLLQMPVQVSYAIDPTQADARFAVQDYRSGGFEVLLAVPQSGELSLVGVKDGEVIRQRIGAMLTKGPETLGLIDGPDAMMQRDPMAVKAVLDLFSQTGHALITYKKGLNSTERAAARLNVPAGGVYRVIDPEGADQDGILRNLRRAVLEANNEGAVILVGSSTEATLAALREFANSPVARGVDIAPVSAAIRKLSNNS